MTEPAKSNSVASSEQEAPASEAKVPSDAGSGEASEPEADREAADRDGKADAQEAPAEPGAVASLATARFPDVVGEERTERTAMPPIVAVGASAGGVEALQAFFERMPSDSGLAFAVVTHQEPHRESMLREILARVTSMEVLDAEHGRHLRPNQVHVASPDGTLGIRRGTFQRYDREVAARLSIDTFFRSLANDQKERSICIILSGAGSDGTVGLQAIKQVGGMAMVQDPRSAGFTGMPTSAISTGLADYVLPPEEMPAALLKYVRGPFLRPRPQSKEAPSISDETRLAILARLRLQTHHDFSGYKPKTICRRIERRMNVHRIEDPETYLKYIRDNPHELHRLFQELLISVTSFFRDQEAFEVLTQRLRERMLERKSGTIRIWIPGCATGEEAFSVAMIADEQMRELDHPLTCQIFATDLDERAIAFARDGTYSSGIEADVSADRLARYFTRTDSRYRINERIRKMVLFASQNVLKDPPFIRLDLIVCRNLLIYLDADVQQELFPLFHYSLEPGGLLMIGASESATGFKELFETVDSTWKIYRRKEAYVKMHPAIRQTPHQLRRPGDVERSGHASHSRSLTGTSSTILETLLTRFAPCCVITDPRGRIIYIHGRSGRYLEPAMGEPSNDIFAMARPGLEAALAPMLRQAESTKSLVQRRNISVRSNGAFTPVDITVAPLNEPESLRGLMLITFEPSPERRDDAPQATAEREGGKGQQDRAGNGQAENAPHGEDERQELEHVKHSLQMINEDLEASNEELTAANEELQSINEELRSANEELETSKEETQSLNEELNTVNSELQSKVTLLDRANDDMNNLLESTEVAAIFLNKQLEILRFTARATRLIRLIESDLGRPLRDLTSTLQYSDLIHDCEEVLRGLVPRERQVQDADGAHYLLRILPYRTSGDVIDGIVITLVDITPVKRAEDRSLQVEASRDFFRSIVETIREPLLVLDGDLRIVLANQSYCRVLSTTEAKEMGQNVFASAAGSWDRPELRRAFQEIAEHAEVVRDFVFTTELAAGDKKTFVINGRRLQQDPLSPELILLSFRETQGEP